MENAILSKYILGKDQKEKQNGKVQGNLKELTLWGVPLLPNKGHETIDVILMKFLKARDFKAIEAFNMLQKTLKWRRRLKIDQILEDFGPDLEIAEYPTCLCVISSYPICKCVFSNIKVIIKVVIPKSNLRIIFLYKKYPTIPKSYLRIEYYPSSICVIGDTQVQYA